MNKYFLLFVCGVLLISCNENSKINQLKDIKHGLETDLQVLQKKLANENQQKQFTIVSDSVRAGEGLFQVLNRMGIADTDRRKIVLAIQDSVELSNLKVGQVFYALKDSLESVEVFRYQENLAKIHLLYKNKKENTFDYKLVSKKLTKKQSVFEGKLEKGSTLNGLLFQVGVPARMVGIVSGVLQCKVAFHQAQPGDRFKVLLEESFYQDSNWIDGKVLYAEFEGRTVGHHQAFRYEDPDPKSTFNAHYTASGEALIFDGLRYPLDRLHITSSFGRRIHPITGARSYHNGVDYGSPRSSPVYAVAEGVVIVSGYDNLSGNKIAIKHRDQSSSWYLHLDKRLVSVGTKVSPRQMIGRVGSTGRSTGPHLHFGFKNAQGKWINPLTKTMIATPKLEGERLKRLQEQIKGIQQELALTEAESLQKINDSLDVFVRMRAIQ
ncbi:MAG: peptidoglycan DD-metalloendopeptidase family protein [Fibrobacter sp.]|nr:peptidoglycan DD-metalloendopeptidase family protein [Fibrobacter sp.]